MKTRPIQPYSLKVWSRYCPDILERTWLPLLIILTVALLAHGLLLISDFRIWDDWVLEEIVLGKGWEDLQRMYNWNGMPIFAYFLSLFSLFENPNYAVKIFSFVCIASSAILIFYIFYKTRFVSRTEALMIALVSLTFPAYRIFGGITYSSLLLSYLIFLGAAFIAFEAEDQKGWKHIWLRVGALAGFFFSFFTGPLLVFYGGFFVALVLFEQNRGGRRLFDIPWRWILKRIDYIYLPFVYWTMFKLFWPPKLRLENHYDISVSVYGLLTGYYSLIRAVMLPSIGDGIALLFSYPILLIMVVIGCYVVARYFRVSAQSLLSPKASTTGLFVFGFLLLVLGTFPYIVTRGGFSTYGLGTRHSLLIPLPVAILSVVLLRYLFHYLSSHHWRQIFTIFLLVLCCFSVINIKTYVSWQAKSVKEHSLQFNLAQMQDVSTYKIIEVRDKFIIPETIPWATFFVWTIQLRHVFGDLTQLAFHNRPQETIRISSKEGEPYTEQELRSLELGPGDSAYLLFNEISYSGKQCALIIRPGPVLRKKIPYIEDRYIPGYVTGTSQQFKLVMRYWYYKMLKPKSIGDFLRQVTSLELKPFQS